MKPIFTILIFFIFYTTAYAVSSINVNDYEDFDSTWASQKVITNQEFETTMDALEERKNQKEEKERKKKLKKFKGSSLHKELDASITDLPDQTLSDIEADEQVILFPTEVLINGKVLEKGFYRAIAEKKEGGVFINFYQAHVLKATLKARETEEDFGEQDIIFIKLLPYKEGVMKLIYGSVEVNAYAYVRYIEPITDFTPQ